MGKKLVFFFGGGKADGRKEMKNSLGGKGANLAEMSGIGLPVPAGFTVSTEVCNLFTQEGDKIPSGVEEEIHQNLKKLEALTQRQFGDKDDPLLLSVRSGAKFSMPGMMDTVLNLGLNDITLQGLVQKTGDKRFAWDCYRRLIQMFGDVVLEIPKKKFEEILRKKKKDNGIANDYDLTERYLEELVSEYKELDISGLKNTLSELEAEYFDLKFQNALAKLENVRLIRQKRRDIAKIKTVIKQRAKQEQSESKDKNSN